MEPPIASISFRAYVLAARPLTCFFLFVCVVGGYFRIQVPMKTTGRAIATSTKSHLSGKTEVASPAAGFGQIWKCQQQNSPPPPPPPLPCLLNRIRAGRFSCLWAMDTRRQRGFWASQSTIPVTQMAAWLFLAYRGVELADLADSSCRHVRFVPSRALLLAAALHVMKVGPWSISC